MASAFTSKSLNCFLMFILDVEYSQILHKKETISYRLNKTRLIFIFSSARLFSPDSVRKGEGSRQVWENYMKRKPSGLQNWDGRDTNTSIIVLPERSGDICCSLQHPQPLSLGRAETVHHWTQRGFRRLGVAPGKKRTDIQKLSCIENLTIFSLTFFCTDVEFKCWHYYNWI